MRKTKIIATLGPSTRSLKALEELIEAGCNVIREGPDVLNDRVRLLL